MDSPNDYITDRSNPPRVIYVEDYKDWHDTYSFPDIVRNGLNLTAGWYNTADSAFLLLVKEDRISEAEKFLGSVEEEVSTPGTVQKLVTFIDPQRLKGKILVFDDKTSSALNGSTVIDAVLKASQTLSDNERPMIISLMASNPDVVEKDTARFREWNKSNVEVMLKDHFPLFIFWMGQKLKQPDLRLREWMATTFQIDYANRFKDENVLKKIEDFNLRLQKLGNYISEETFPDRFKGILGIVTSDQIATYCKGEGAVYDVNKNEIIPLFDRWKAEFRIDPEGQVPVSIANCERQL